MLRKEPVKQNKSKHKKDEQDKIKIMNTLTSLYEINDNRENNNLLNWKE